MFLAALSEVGGPPGPGLAEEIVERARREPVLPRAAGPRSATSPAPSSLPPTVRSVIAARLDLLGPLSSRTCCCARPFPAAGSPDPGLGALLEAEPAVTAPPGQALEHA